MIKKLSMVAVLLMLIIFGYFFISTVYQPDEKKFSHGRIYVDYTTHNSRRHISARYNYTNMNVGISHPNAYKAAEEARRLQRTMFSNLTKETANAYNAYMQNALKGVPSPKLLFPKPHLTPEFEKINAYYKVSLPNYESGVTYFGKGNYRLALKKFNRALSNIDQQDVKHKIDIFSMIAECYLNLKNSDGYVEYKIKEVRMTRKLKRILEEVYPSQKSSFKQMDWATTEEASRRMLKIKLLAMKMQNNPGIRKMLLRAKLDLTIARRVSL